MMILGNVLQKLEWKLKRFSYIKFSYFCPGIQSAQFLSDFWATTFHPRVAKTREILLYLALPATVGEQPKIWWSSAISYTRHQKMNFINLLFLAPQFEFPDLILLYIFHKPLEEIKSVLVQCCEYKAMYSLWYGVVLFPISNDGSNKLKL